uniref:Microfibril associated protein 4 n=1 Tax=Sinocyclocheilus grahami TaxID=75366 RepID=A0A672KC44_SINGR
MFSVFLVILLVFFLMRGCSQDKDMPVDCSDLYNSGQTVSGIYSIYPAGDFPVWVYCQMISDGKDEDKGGWTNMYQLTRNRNYKLRVDLEDFQGNKAFAQYSSFSVDPEADGYELHVSGFTDGGAGDSLSGHNGYKFSTFDKDQDISPLNCAKRSLGAFWYFKCHHANPNGWYLWGEDATHYAIGNVWFTWKGYAVGMKSISMKIKPVS